MVFKLVLVFELVFMKFSGLKQIYMKLFYDTEMFTWLLVCCLIPGSLQFYVYVLLVRFVQLEKREKKKEKKKDILPALLEMHKLQTD